MLLKIKWWSALIYYASIVTPQQPTIKVMGWVSDCIELCLLYGYNINIYKTDQPSDKQEHLHSTNTATSAKYGHCLNYKRLNSIHMKWDRVSHFTDSILANDSCEKPPVSQEETTIRDDKIRNIICTTDCNELRETATNLEKQQSDLGTSCENEIWSVNNQRRFGKWAGERLRIRWTGCFPVSLPQTTC